MTSTKIRLAIMMFLQYAIWGAWTTGLGQQLAKLGFGPTEIGGIFSCLWLACIIAPLIGGQIVDRFFPTQVFLGVSHLVGAVLLYLTGTQTEYQSMFWWMLAYSLLYAPTLALTNSLAFHHLADAEQDFGRVRLWGTVGWIVAGIAIAEARAQWHTENWAGSVDLLLYAAGISAVMGLFCFSLPHTPPKKEASNPLAFLEALSLLKDRNFLIFILVAFVVTTELQFYYIPTSNYLVDLGVEEAQVTMVMTVAQVAEILVLLFLLHHSLKRFGVRVTMVIGMIAWPIRYFLFATGYLPIAVGSLTLHGFGYAFFFVASQIYVDRKAGNDMRASAQAMLTLFTLGLGNYLGTLFTGWIWDHFAIKGADGAIEATRWTPFFMVPAGICIVAAVVFMVFFRDDVKQSRDALGEAGAKAEA